MPAKKRTTMRSMVFVACVVVSMAGFASPTKYPQKLAIPAYFPLNSDWSTIQGAGSYVGIVVPEASFENASGSELEPARNQFSALRQVGQKVLGYVATGHFIGRTK